LWRGAIVEQGDQGRKVNLATAEKGKVRVVYGLEAFLRIVRKAKGAESLDRRRLEGENRSENEKGAS